MHWYIIKSQMKIKDFYGNLTSERYNYDKNERKELLGKINNKNQDWIIL